MDTVRVLSCELLQMNVQSKSTRMVGYERTHECPVRHRGPLKHEEEFPQ